MTAYLLTAEQHAQIVDALKAADLEVSLIGIRGSDADHEIKQALAMLRAMKPQTPAAWRTIESDEKKPIRLDEWFYASNPDYVTVHKYKWVPLYALGDTA